MHMTRVLGQVACWLLLMMGCGPRPEASSGTVQLAISAHQGVFAEDITRVTVTVSAVDMETLTMDLTRTGDGWRGSFEDIPAGTGRYFNARAYEDNRLWHHYRGDVHDVVIVAGARALVSITLQETSFTPVFDNEVPIIDALVVSSLDVVPGGRVELTVVAHDPSPGDVLTYTWSAQAGHFTQPSNRTSAWLAPLVAGPVTLTLQVSDGRGSVTGVSMTLNVLDGAPGPGTASVDVSFNRLPTIHGITVTKGRVAVLEGSTLTATVSDADGDGVGYAWSAGCQGDWTGGEQASATFIPSELPALECNNCRITLQVRDSRGGNTVGFVNLCVAPPPVPGPPPPGG